MKYMVTTSVYGSHCSWIAIRRLDLCRRVATQIGWGGSNLGLTPQAVTFRRVATQP